MIESDQKALIDIIECLDNIELKETIYIVELGANSGEPAMHKHDYMRTILIQFAGGMKKDRILYIGPNKNKAELIHNSVLKTMIHVNEILNNS